MDPDQFAIFLKQNEAANAAAIEKYVNGGIRDLRKLVEEHNARHEEDMVEVRKHIEEVRPYLDSARGVKLLGETGKWIAGVVVTCAAAWAVFFKQ